jgi:beta-glucosidase
MGTGELMAVLVRSLGKAILVVLVGLSLHGSAEAALTPEQGQCQRRLAAAADKYVKRSAAILASCHDLVSRGRLPEGTSCWAEPVTLAKLEKMAAKLGKRLQGSCSDAVVASLTFGGACADASTVTALAACLQASHQAQVDSLIRILYATSGELGSSARVCQSRASQELRAFAVRRLGLLRRCKDRVAKEKLPTGTECAGDPTTLARIAGKRSGVEAAIAAHCGVAALGEAEFGSPCADVADGAELAMCLLSVAETAGDAASLAQYGDGGFCGDSYQAVEGRVTALIAQMTLEEKVAQMHGIGIILVDGLWSTAENERLGIPGFRMVDGPRGVGAYAGNATAFPVGMARGATWDPELEERVGAAMGEEVRAKGGSVLLAPTTTVVRHPQWGRCQETYGEDPLHVGRMGVGFVRGVQRHVIASAKHFALNSIEDTRFEVSVNVDERSLREIYLPHFRMVVQDGEVGSIMSAYNRVNGQYCAENFHLLRDILKGEWGFRGFVESDWIAGTHSTVASALAGLDIEMPSPIYYGNDLLAAVGAGDVPESTIDEAVRRILRTQFCFRLDSDPPVPDPSQVESPEHIALALEVAQKAIVLLKNAGPLLPLERTQVTSLAVVGPLADFENLGDNGSSDVEPTSSVTVLEGLQNRAGGVSITHVLDPNSPGGQVTLAAADAAIVVVGFTAADEGEGFPGVGDRDTYELHQAQQELILDVAALNDATIVVLEGGSAIGVESWIDEVEALLMAWYPGLEGGNAIADILFGDVNPSGKLPLTFARSESHYPPFINDQDEVTYHYYLGYRLFDRDAVEPRFPFGFGLSYTSYAYANLSIADPTLEPDETLRVSFEVTNTGAVAGEEIAQLYVSYQGSGVHRAERDLKAFARVPLQPGETKVVSLEVPVEDLAYYDVAAGAWRIERIGYGVQVGPSSRNLPLSASFQVVGPNFVFVLADDLGYGDLGSYGNTEIKTPNLDRLAEEGVRFTQFYAGNSTCSPSRATFLTGRYSIRMPLDDRGVLFPDSTGGLDPAEITIAEVLKEQGYATALIGKWHLGHLPEFLPTQQGFDYFYGTLQQRHGCTGLPRRGDAREPLFPLAARVPPVRALDGERPHPRDAGHPGDPHPALHR